MMALALAFENNTIFDKEVGRERSEKFKGFILRISVYSKMQNPGLSHQKNKIRVR